MDIYDAEMLFFVLNSITPNYANYSQQSSG